MIKMNFFWETQSDQHQNKSSKPKRKQEKLQDKSIREDTRCEISFINAKKVQPKRIYIVNKRNEKEKSAI